MATASAVQQPLWSDPWGLFCCAEEVGHSKKSLTFSRAGGILGLIRLHRGVARRWRRCQRGRLNSETGEVDFYALINIRPRQSNRGIEVEDLTIRTQMEAIIGRLLGKVQDE